MPETGAAGGSDDRAGEPGVLDVLALEEIDRDLYRGTLLFPDTLALYGGQVAAQALYAAGRTVPPERLPHSLHGYFLRGRDAARPVVFRVERDRDGRSFSARRVVALQAGEVLFNMSTSFAVAGEGPDRRVDAAPDAEAPDASADYQLPRLFGMEIRLPTQQFPRLRWPAQFWARTCGSLPDDPLLHACALTYLSDFSTGLASFDDEDVQTGVSLDHSLWFHRPIRLDEWVLMDMVPGTVAGGRGWYTGTLTTGDGVLGASFAQETLFRPEPWRFPPGGRKPELG
jgi:acyl-CoA thioesterase-2